ncbi:MAG: hypothetical protein GVY11_05810 [Gammaproteobacteria bacterium]|jgi:hypothetical protein|nr:hypothetical protein [Gammaproteobacteria bacterium]
MAVEPEDRVASFTFHRGWSELTETDAEAVVAFWRREGALPRDQDPRRRVGQVVMFARDADGKVAGVSTAVPQWPERLAQPVYYYRSFIAPAWRHTQLVYRLLRKSVRLLEDDARAHDWPCIGVLLELENRRFGEAGRMPVWPKIDFVYIGQSPRGLECRVHWFRDAGLKEPGRAMQQAGPGA